MTLAGPRGALAPWRTARRRWLLLVVGLLALSSAIVVPAVMSYPTLSPIDELQHADYARKAASLQVVREGEKVSTPTLREQSCRGIDAPGFVSPPCTAATLDPGDYQEAGYNTASVHPPTYYVVSGSAARLATLVPGIDSPLTGARLAGAGWLAAGLLVTWLLARTFGASPGAAAAVTVLLASTPAVVLASTTVTPDAAALVSGGVVVLATVRYARGQVSAPWLAAGAVAAVSCKATGILAVGACCLALLLGSPGTSSGRRSWWQRLQGPLWLGAGGAVPIVFWTLVTQARALPVPPSPLTRFLVDGLTVEQVLGNLLATFPPTQNPYLQPDLREPVVLALIPLAGYLLLLGLAAAALLVTPNPSDHDSERVLRAVAGSTLATMLIGGPLLVALFFLTSGAYFPVPARYGASLLPAGAAALAVVASRRTWLRAAVGVVAGAQLVGLLVSLSV